jgi:uncharacterized protein involved in tolerance to divalent cations
MTSPPELKLLLSTLPSPEEAERIAALLVEERLAELHPYDVPEILVLSVESGLPAFLNWAAEECSPG